MIFYYYYYHLVLRYIHMELKFQSLPISTINDINVQVYISKRNICVVL